MADRIKELLNKVLEWWNKFSTKQKTFISGSRSYLSFCNFNHNIHKATVCYIGEL